MILHIILITIFYLLAFTHFYWGLNGKWGIEKVIPTKNDEEIITPKTYSCFIVSAILFAFGSLYLINNKVVNYSLPSFSNYFLWIIPSIFLLRAIGDFKYVGFFKSITNTLFAKWDTKLFSPLCLLISILGFLINLLN